jgi:pimeloyl-ACP methyl ester carboxylesterase
MRPPILLVHGAFSSAAHLAPLAEQFRSAGYVCRAPDLPGHGRERDRTLGTVDIDDVLGALGEACVSFERPPVIVGHGLGGLLAQHLRATTDCAGIVLLASWPAGKLRPRARAMLNALPMIPGILGGRAVRCGRSVAATLALHDLSVGERADIIAEMGAESGRVLRAPIFGRIEVPITMVRHHVLVVSGSADRIVRQRTALDLARLYQAEHVVLPGAGHWLIAGSLAPTVASIVAEWLERLQKGALAVPGDPSFRIATDV